MAPWSQMKKVVSKKRVINNTSDTNRMKDEESKLTIAFSNMLLSVTMMG